MTLHSALLLNQRVWKMSNRTKADLVGLWQGIDYFFIDEVSMIGCKTLLLISEALAVAKEHPYSPFGNISIIFAGDFAQLPPVRETRLYQNINTATIATRNGQDNVLGKLLWLSVTTVVMLTEIWRQTGRDNERFLQLLHRLRIGQCNDDDFRLLKTRLLERNKEPLQKNEWANVPVIVSGNELKDSINIESVTAFAQQTGRPLHWYYASDAREGSEITSPDLREHLRNLDTGKTNGRMGKLPLVIGMPVMICQNFDVEGGVVNGCVGTLVKIRYKENTAGERQAISCVVRSDNVEKDIHPDLESDEVVALRDEIQLQFTHPHSGQVSRFYRKQVPILPAFSITAHKSQGQTLERVIIDLNKCSGTESAYVMISRAKSLDGIIILRPFNKSKISCNRSERVRNEFIRLEILRLQTIINVGTHDERIQAEKILQLCNISAFEQTKSVVVEHGNNSSQFYHQCGRDLDEIQPQDVTFRKIPTSVIFSFNDGSTNGKKRSPDDPVERTRCKRRRQ